MNCFVNRNGESVLRLHQNAILLPESEDVVGVVLGQCVFGAAGEIKGKYIKGCIYDTTGNIIATESKADAIPVFLLKEIIIKACAILQKITNHHCPWIVPNTTWITVSASELFKV